MWRLSIVLAMIAATLIVGITLGVRQAYALFLVPISGEFGWGREVFAMAIAIQQLLWGISQPFAGAIADRYGSGRVIALGGVGFAAGVWLLSVTTTPMALYLSAGLLVGISLSAGSFAVVLAAIARQVPPARRTTALGICSAGGSLGMFAMIPIAQGFIDDYGWVSAATILAVISLASVPLARGLRGRAADAVSAVPQGLGEAVREAAGHNGFLLLNLGFFMCGFHVFLIATHLPAYALDNGLSTAEGAWALALIGLFNVIGSWLWGALGDRFSKRRLLAAIYLLRAVVIALFLWAPVSALSLQVFAAAMGLLWLSTVPLTSALVAQVFGPRYMATLFGIVFLSHQVGGFLGAWMGGRLYDAVGNYDVAWWIAVALGVLAALVHLPIDERPVARLSQAHPG